jgi:hypothetical protein
MIRDDSFYILLSGSAVILADDLVETQIALAGPPDIFSGSWHKPPRAADVPASRAAESGTHANELEDQGSCDSRVTRSFQLFSSGADLHIMIRVQSGMDRQAFQQTGFASGDLIVTIDGRPIRPEDDLHHWMREAAHGRPVKFSVKRDGSAVEVVLQPENARRALAQCIAIDRKVPPDPRAQ